MPLNDRAFSTKKNRNPNLDLSFIFEKKLKMQKSVANTTMTINEQNKYEKCTNITSKSVARAH